MKTLVLYHSLTGNTKKVATAIAKSKNADLKSIDEEFDLDNYECVIFGFYVDRGFFVPKAENVAKNIKNKTMGLFFTLGAEPDGDHAKDCEKKAIDYFTKLGNNVKATFCCQGAIDPKVIEQMRQMAAKMGDKAVHQITPQREARWKRAASHPDENDIKNAVLAFESL